MSVARRRSRTRALATILALLGALFFGGLFERREARADDHVAVRGQYYREPSTRVVQPVVEVAKDLPAGWNVKASYLLDAITSASAASGPSSDNIFTEIRNEERLAVSKSWSRSSLGASYRYSAESDYWSHTVSLAYSQRVWADTGTIYAFGGAGFDVASRRVQGANPMQQRLPCPDQAPATKCDLLITFAGLSYAQVLSPTLLAQVGYDIARLDGFQGSPYRLVPGTTGLENVPGHRLRNAVAARVAWYLPPAKLGFQAHYRFYWDTFPDLVPETSSTHASPDPWKITSHTIEVRAFKQLTANLEARLGFRYYRQSSAAFWCDLNQNASCYAQQFFTTTDPKLGPVHTYYPELKLTWEARPLAGLPVLGWFSTGAFDIAYGRYFQSTAFHDADVVQVGYLMPY